MSRARSTCALVAMSAAIGTAACGDRATSRFPEEGASRTRGSTSAAASPSTSPAAPPEDGPRFDCRGPVPSCDHDACPDEMTCAGNGNFACGDTPPLGRPCPPGTCELAGEDVASRACLPVGCCEAAVRLPEVPGCDPEQTRARFEVVRAGLRDAWTSCILDSSAADTVHMAFIDGTHVVYAFPRDHRPGIGAPTTIRGFVRLPPSRFDGAVIALGAGATSEQNQHGQWRISATSAHAVGRSGAIPVAGAVSYDDTELPRKHDFGTVDGARLDVDQIGLKSCGRMPQDVYTCSIFMGTNADPTWIFVRFDDQDQLVDGLVARYDPGGANVFVASRGSKDAKSRVEVGGFGRLPRVEDAAEGNAVLRVTLDQ